MLRPLTRAYAAWIDDQVAKLQDPLQGLDSYKSTAETAITNCRRTLARIEAGLDILIQNPQAV